jgi:hypothetical protein
MRQDIIIIPSSPAFLAQLDRRLAEIVAGSRLTLVLARSRRYLSYEDTTIIPSF